MTDGDWAALALPRLAPIEDPDAYLRAALRWHFGSDTGSRYWLERAKGLDFNPLTEVSRLPISRGSPTSSTNYATCPSRISYPPATVPAPH